MQFTFYVLCVCRWYWPVTRIGTGLIALAAAPPGGMRKYRWELLPAERAVIRTGSSPAWMPSLIGYWR